jgi:hypothetical protein
LYEGFEPARRPEPSRDHGDTLSETSFLLAEHLTVCWSNNADSGQEYLVCKGYYVLLNLTVRHHPPLTQLTNGDWATPASNEPGLTRREAGHNF